MATTAVVQKGIDEEDSNAVRAAMRRIVLGKLHQAHDSSVDTAELFREVTETVGQTARFVKPIELSNALLDLMDERVVKWNGAFRLVASSSVQLNK